ncbi:DUF2489 domain-containing protein [Thalassotalea atypica]|uniref:DUF2489 domain-containing protein n=1 Tax=Thalassotalea atypica TaxID=2054316 RepID=UPI002573BB6F|nr:DUF2489 domain-containing protein [Thalassotalea atypica]
MLENNWFYLAIAGALIIVALALYAGKLLMLVKQQTKQQQAAQAAHQAQMYANDVKIYDSVIIITRAMKEQQCDYSEGSWRISVLLDSLQTTNNLDQKFPAIFELYNSIKHLSILEDRKSLSKQQRMKQDVERLKLEADLSARIDEDLITLHQFAEQQKGTLT